MSSNTTTLNFKVDDTDPRIHYSGNWFKGGVASEYHSTTHGTRTARSNATFAFNGTFVAAFGTIDQFGTSYYYILDSEQPKYVNYTGISPPSYGQPLFALEGLADQEHTIILGSAASGPALWLDYLSYTGRESQTFLPVDTSPPPTQPRPSLSPSVIAALVLASLAVLLGAALGIIVAKRRWHRWRLSRPREDASIKEKGFEILPVDDRPKMQVIDAIRYKLLRLPAPHPAASGAQSSTVFTSVILSFPHPYSNHSGSQ